MHRAYASFDKTKKGSMQQRELADLRSAFLVSEETTPADNLGNLRGHHLVPGFVPRSDALDCVPRKDRQISPLASPGAKAGNIRGRFLKKKSRSRELGLAVSVERIKGKGTLVSTAAKSG